MHSKSGNAQAPAPNDDLKNFYIKVALNKESIKAVSICLRTISSNFFQFSIDFNYMMSIQSYNQSDQEPNQSFFPFLCQQKISEGHKLMITFKYDTLCDAHIRINMCVTEKKNPNNAPEMFYTPNRENYI